MLEETEVSDPDLESDRCEKVEICRVGYKKKDLRNDSRMEWRREDG